MENGFRYQMTITCGQASVRKSLDEKYPVNGIFSMT